MLQRNMLARVAALAIALAIPREAPAEPLAAQLERLASCKADCRLSVPERKGAFAASHVARAARLDAAAFSVTIPEGWGFKLDFGREQPLGVLTAGPDGGSPTSRSFMNLSTSKEVGHPAMPGLGGTIHREVWNGREWTVRDYDGDPTRHNWMAFTVKRGVLYFVLAVAVPERREAMLAMLQSIKIK
jgi:hypothetical protein